MHCDGSCRSTTGPHSRTHSVDNGARLCTPVSERPPTGAGCAHPLLPLGRSLHLPRGRAHQSGLARSPPAQAPQAAQADASRIFAAQERSLWTQLKMPNWCCLRRRWRDCCRHPSKLSNTRAQTLARPSLSMSSAKRSRRGHHSSTSPCAVVPLAGRLRDGTDVLAMMAKLTSMAICDDDLAIFAKALGALQSRSSDGIVRFGSMCSGSGLGDQAIHALLSALRRCNPDVPNMQCNFLCECDKRKADFLKRQQIANLIFKDITTMGSETAQDWVSGKHQEVPDVSFLFFGFSCKDLSRMNQDANAATQYVLTIVKKFLKSPNDPCFDMLNLQETPLEGTTAPTLIGALQYVRRHLPEYVLMENVPGVLKLMKDIMAIFASMGYVFFCSCTMTPTMFALPNARPRVYFGGRRRHTIVKNPSTYEADCMEFVRCTIKAYALESPMVLEDFLLDVEHPYYASLLSGGGSVDDTSTSEGTWVDQHERAFQSINVPRPSSATLKHFAAGAPSETMKRLILQQSQRAQEVAYFASLTIPPVGPEQSIDLSQSIDRVNVTDSDEGDSRLGCFTARSVIFLVRARRLMTGRERLAMHGLSLPLCEEFGFDPLLADLAGNSFSATSFMVAFLAGCR